MNHRPPCVCGPPVLFVRGVFPAAQAFDISMDISRDEQRVLHALAQGGRIALIRNPQGKATGLEFFNRDGWLISGCSLPLFRKLKAKKAIKSTNGQPYRITRRGLELVRSQVDNR
tara:strand:+ start:2036 stop:2380 length:345 start_codon:yes stop_codon:yes gene_type:complete